MHQPPRFQPKPSLPSEAPLELFHRAPLDYRFRPPTTRKPDVYNVLISCFIAFLFICHRERRFLPSLALNTHSLVLQGLTNVTALLPYSRLLRLSSVIRFGAVLIASSSLSAYHSVITRAALLDLCCFPVWTRLISYPTQTLWSGKFTIRKFNSTSFIREFLSLLLRFKSYPSHSQLFIFRSFQYLCSIPFLYQALPLLCASPLVVPDTNPTNFRATEIELSLINSSNCSCKQTWPGFSNHLTF